MRMYPARPTLNALINIMDPAAVHNFVLQDHRDYDLAVVAREGAMPPMSLPLAIPVLTSIPEGVPEIIELSEAQLRHFYEL